METTQKLFTRYHTRNLLLLPPLASERHCDTSGKRLCYNHEEKVKCFTLFAAIQLRLAAKTAQNMRNDCVTQSEVVQSIRGICKINKSLDT